MKKFALLLSLVFVGGVAVAQETKTAPPAKAKAEAQKPAEMPMAARASITSL